MKKAVLMFVLIFSVSLWAGEKDKAEYNINVHVSGVEWFPANGAAYMKLDVIVDGKKLLMYVSPSSIHPGTFSSTAPVLNLGNYKARLSKDKASASYETEQAYELLMPDGKVVKCILMGMHE